MSKNHSPISFQEAQLKLSPGSHKLVYWICPECKVTFTKTFKTALAAEFCKPCRNKLNAATRMAWVRERGNPMAGKVPFKGETPRCVDCGRAVSSRNTQRCQKCYGKTCSTKKRPYEEYRVWKRAHIKNKMLSDPEFKLSYLLRSRLYKALRRGSKRGSAVRDLGCTIAELKVYLESQFQPGMTWENWSYEGWHIDHKKPLASFDLTDRVQFLQAVHFTNLQPMWAKDNIRKGGKI